jgi:hypothetical protein
MGNCKLLTVLAVLLMLGWSAGARAQAMDIAITINDGTSSGTKILNFGIDPAATDGIDAALGESELPPTPPAGVFDARFIGTDIGKNLGQGLARDYRQGTVTAKVTHVHELAYQLGAGTVITIIWSLPDSVKGVLEDLFGGILVKKTMSGKDSLKVTNPSVLNKLKMTITYSPLACPTVSGISPTNGAAGTSVTITGDNFAGITAVKFSNNVSAVFTITSATQISTTVPNGAVTGPITLSKTGCADLQTGVFTVNTPALCPIISGIDPAIFLG